MKRVCPQCQARLKISGVPAAGAWARCPRCRERFHVGGESKPAAPLPAPVQRNAEAQKLIERLRARRGRPGRSSPEGRAAPPPRPSPAFRFYGALAGLAAALSLIALGVIFRAAAPPAEPPPPPPAPARIYDHKRAAEDLAALKADLTRRSGLARDIGYSGRETRVFKYFLARLAPEACREIEGLRLWSPKSAEGFRAVGSCLGGGGSTPALEINWAAEPARVFLVGAPGAALAAGGE